MSEKIYYALFGNSVGSMCFIWLQQRKRKMYSYTKKRRNKVNDTR